MDYEETGLACVPAIDTCTTSLMVSQDEVQHSDVCSSTKCKNTDDIIVMSWIWHVQAVC